MKLFYSLVCVLLLFGCSNSKESDTINLHTKENYSPIPINNSSTNENDSGTLEENLMNHQRADYGNENEFITQFFEEKEPFFTVNTQLENDINKLNMVKESSIVIVEDSAYVGIKTVSSVFTEDLKNEIHLLIKQQYPEVTNINIDTSEDFTEELNKYKKNITNEVPLKEWFVDFSTSIENVFEMN